MSNLKRNTLLILFAMLILFTVPMSFASDINATEIGTSDAPSDIVQYSEENVISDSENGFYIHENPIEINEGESATITGEIMLDGNNVWEDLNFKYSYVDSNGITQSRNLEYRPFDDDTEYTITISDLTASNSPYIVTFSIIEDDLYEEFLWYSDEIQDEIVTINVIGTNTPIEDPALPEYTTITPEGQLYVDDNNGNDENDGSESTPFKTIQKALDQNEALGGNYEVVVNAGTYDVAGYSILKPVRITGRGNVIIDAQQNDYHFSASATTVEFYNLIFINGNGLIGSISGSSSNSNTGKVLNIINCTFKDNSGMIGVLRTYATTTILNSNFINNVATSTSSGWGNIIYCSENSLTVRFSNFIDNTVKSGKTTIDSVEKSDANYNFWGSNDGPSASDVGEKVTAKAWVVLDATLDATTINAGSNYTITMKNKYVKGEETGDLTIPMANLDVDLFAEEGTVTPSTVTVSNNLGEATYTAPNATDDAIIIKTYSHTLKTINVDNIEPAIVIQTSIVADDLVMSYKDGSAWNVTLTDGINPIVDATVKIGILGKIYNRITDANGVASLPINLAPGSYDINATFDEEGYESAFIDATITVNKATPVLSGENLVMSYKDGSGWTVALTGVDDVAIPNVNINIGILGKVYTIKTNDEGIAALPINLASGTYEINATFDGNKYYSNASVEATITVNKAVPVLTADDLVMSYKDGSVYSVTLTDANGNAIANTYVKVTIGSTTYSRKTDENGVATLPINLPIGQYNVTAKFDGDNKYDVVEISNTITVNKPEMSIVAEDVNMTYKDGTSYDVQLTDGEGNPIAMAGEIIKITIKGKTYDRKTNSEGIATLPINLIAGTYAITAEYNGNTINNTITVNNA